MQTFEEIFNKSVNKISSDYSIPIVISTIDTETNRETIKSDDEKKKELISELQRKGQHLRLSDIFETSESIIEVKDIDFGELFFTQDGIQYWNDPTTLDTLETVNLVDNDQIKHQEEKVIPWQINYTQTSSNKRLSTKL